MDEMKTKPCTNCSGTGSVRDWTPPPRYEPTVDEMFEAMVVYEETHHLPDCTLSDPKPSYCLDCHAGVYNLREQLRKLGKNKYPKRLRKRVEAARTARAA